MNKIGWNRAQVTRMRCFFKLSEGDSYLKPPPYSGYDSLPTFPTMKQRLIPFLLAFSLMLSLSLCWGQQSTNSANTRTPIRLESALIPQTYLQCNQQISVILPKEIQAQTTLEASATGAIVRPHAHRKTDFNVVPLAQDYELNILHQATGQEAQTDRFYFRAVPPPRPQVQLWINRQKHSNWSPISRISRIHVQLIPNPDFRARFPAEATYAIDAINIYAVMTAGEPTLVNQITPKKEDFSPLFPVYLGTQIRQMEGITLVYIVLEGIHRINFEGTRVEEAFSLSERTFAFVVR